jgi:hypothetical protein
MQKLENLQEPRTSCNTKKVIALIFIFSFVFFIKYSPYSGTQIIGDSLGKEIFILYFFIVNQTLGIVHEGGHGVCYILPCPTFLMVINGTIFQLLFPYLVGYYYKRKNQIFPYLIGLFFLGVSLQYTAWYISTAHEGAYVSASKSFLGQEGLHDFHYILSSLHLLEYNHLISILTRIIAYLLMLYSSIKMFGLAFFSFNKKGGNPC